MRSSPAWEIAYNEIKSLAECLQSYAHYLEFQNDKVKTNQNLNYPVRQVCEDTSVITVKRNVFGVLPEYKLIDKALALVDFNTPVLFDETKHLQNRFENNMQRLRFFTNLQLSHSFDMFKYFPGGGIITVYGLVKVHENRSENEKSAQIAKNLLKLKPIFPEAHTRAMKRSFKERVKNVANVQPALLDVLYKELTLDATTESHPDTKQRIRMILMGETGLLSDLRKLNPGRPSGMFDVFFEKLGGLIEEFTAADDRRHNVAHMSQVLSLKDLIEQTKERCPEGTDIPSKALVHLQFTPRNPYANTALTFTSKLPVQYKIQRRQLRVSHPDDHYCSALFKYLRNYAIEIQKDCCLFFCDDKSKVPVGEPGTALSTGVRGKQSLTLTETTLAAADHDVHHKGSLTPSVYLRCDIPDEMEKSFYRGQVSVIVNDSIFQSSNPMRHSTSIVNQVKLLVYKPSVILKFSDQRNTLESVKCTSICIFKELDLDMFVAARCAPGQSWTNPAERVMSILNIGLQNCALTREKGSDELEKMLKSCTSMAAVRELGQKDPDVKEQWETTIEPVRRIVENRFRRLTLKDEPFQVLDPLPDAEVDYLSRHLSFLFPGLDKDKLVKSSTMRVKAYTEWVQKHCRQR